MNRRTCSVGYGWFRVCTKVCDGFWRFPGLVPKSASRLDDPRFGRCFGEFKTFPKIATRFHGDHPVLDDAPAAITSSCVLDYLSPKACLRITPPADGTDEATLRVGAHRLRDPCPLGSSPGTFVHDQPKNQGCFLDNVLVVTTSEPRRDLPNIVIFRRRYFLALSFTLFTSGFQLSGNR